MTTGIARYARRPSISSAVSLGGIPYPSGVNNWMLTAIKSLESLCGLPDDWDTYGSPRVQPEAREGAAWLLTALSLADPFSPHICAVPGGGLQFEWAKGGRELEIEVLPDGTIEFLAVFDDGEMVEGRFPDRSHDYLARLFEQLWGSRSEESFA